MAKKTKKNIKVRDLKPAKDAKGGNPHFLGAGNLGAGNLGAGNLGAGNLGAGNLGAGNLGSSDLGAGNH